MYSLCLSFSLCLSQFLSLSLSLSLSQICTNCAIDTQGTDLCHTTMQVHGRCHLPHFSIPPFQQIGDSTGSFDCIRSHSATNITYWMYSIAPAVIHCVNGYPGIWSAPCTKTSNRATTAWNLQSPQ